jgi:RsmE family RNA methyltransferase
MNALILFPEELQDKTRAVLEYDRAKAFISEQRLELQQTIRLVVLDQFHAYGKIIALSEDRIEIVVAEPEPLRSRLPVALFIATPRPQTVKKVISLAVQCGVSALYFVKSYNTVPSYLQSHSVRELDIRAEGIKALAQVWDAHLPEIQVLPKMAAFFNNIIPAYQQRYSRLRYLLAEPQQPGTVALSALAAFTKEDFVLLGVGPEKGWSDSEKEGFAKLGFSLIHLDDREYRVETALALLLGQLKGVISGL